MIGMRPEHGSLAADRQLALEPEAAPSERAVRPPSPAYVDQQLHTEQHITGVASGCSVGVMAYNEEANIADAIHSILQQPRIAEVIVVASGCEDRTGAIVVDIARREPRVRLVEQERREGKASAINLFINASRSPLLVMVGADLLVKDGTIDALLRHFEDPAVGMVGGHPTPVNDETTFLGHAVHLQWRLHDRIARHSPKLGEIVAFRNVVPSIPMDTAVDELSIEALITQLGYSLVYEPEAIVYNRGPTTVRDFLLQRRRIHAGHLQIREQQGYSASTMSGWVVARALWGSQSFTAPRRSLWSLGTVGLEITARALGHYDVVRRRPQHIWDVSGTTKRHIAEGADAYTQHSVVVMHIADFHRHQLELGFHACRQLTRRLAEQIKRDLGSAGTVSTQQAGTIIVLLLGDREVAERTACQLVQRFESVPFPLNGHGETVRIALNCGIVAFPPAGPPLASSIPVPTLDADPVASIAS